MSDRASELFDEINQLIRQYRQEVPGNRKTWPKSIRERVIELRRLGLAPKEISGQTGISYHTMAYWFEKGEAGFEAVKVVPVKPPVTVTIAKSPLKKRITRTLAPKAKAKESSSTVTVTLPGGVRIEGANVNFLKALLPGLRGKS